MSTEESEEKARDEGKWMGREIEAAAVSTPQKPKDAGTGCAGEKE